MKQLTLVILFLCGLTAVAQQPREFSVKGKVLDLKTKEPLAYATVTLIASPDNQSTVYSDDKGAFLLKGNPGKYQLTVALMTYKSFTKTDIQLDKDIVIEDILLDTEAKQLDEVNIVAEKSSVELKLDKKVFNVGKDILSKGGSANDILNNVPSVNVDVSGNVTLRGNAGVTVLINGKPSMLTNNNGLSQISAANIEKVEVITNPSAAYEAQGGAGIINIVLKKNSMQGFNGSLQVSVGNPANHNLNANLSYKTEKVNLFSNIGYRYFEVDASNRQFQRHWNEGTTTVLNQNDNIHRHNNTVNFYIGGDYYINAKNTLTGSYYHDRSNNNYDTDFNYQYANGSNVTDSVITRHERYREPKIYNALELNYVKTFEKKDQKWTTSLQYDFWNDDENQDISQQKIYPAQPEVSNLYSRDIESSNDIFIKSDYVNPISEKSRIEMGIRSDLRAIRSDYHAVLDGVLQEQYTNKLKYDENLYSAYFQFGSKINKFSYLLGLRSELSDINIEDTKNTFGKHKTYVNLFPTVHLTYAVTEKTDLQLSYSKRINRPRFWQLNPFGGLSDVRYITTGNPDLNPMFTNSFEFAALTKIGKLSLNPSLYYQHTTNYFEFILKRTEENYFVRTPVNLDTENRYGFELATSYNPVNWLRLSLDFNYYKFDQQGTYENVEYKVKDKTWFTNFRSVVKFPKIISGEFSFRYRGRNEGVQTVTKAQYNSNIGVSKDFFDDKMSMTLNVNNLFNSQITKQETTTQFYHIESEFKSQGRYITFTVIYRFNRKKDQADRLPDAAN